MKTNPRFESQVATVERETSLKDAAKVMRDRHVGDVVVVERGRDGRMKPVGILTDRDIVVSVIAEGMPWGNLLAQDVMCDELVTTKAGASLEEIALTMRVAGVRRLPVVDADGMLVGIIVADDVYERLSRQLAALAKVPRRQIRNENEVRAERTTAAGK